MHGWKDRVAILEINQLYEPLAAEQSTKKSSGRRLCCNAGGNYNAGTSSRRYELSKKLGEERIALSRQIWPRLDSIADSLPHVKASEDALNAYVHPNYGSHIAALYSEGAAAAHLLLTAILYALECFLSSNAARATQPSPKSSNRVSWSSGSPKRKARRQ
jgi:hypothetical protein